MNPRPDKGSGVQPHPTPQVLGREQDANSPSRSGDYPGTGSADVLAMTRYRPEVGKWTLAACEEEDLMITPHCAACRKWVAVLWSRVPAAMKDRTLGEVVAGGGFRCRVCGAPSRTVHASMPTREGLKFVWSSDGEPKADTARP